MDIDEFLDGEMQHSKRETTKPISNPEFDMKPQENESNQLFMPKTEEKKVASSEIQPTPLIASVNSAYASFRKLSRESVLFRS